jgi:hypothetical protein
VRPDRLSESDLVRASWDGRVQEITYPVSNPCRCGHETVAHMQSVGRCCATGCGCVAAVRDYGHPGTATALRVTA